MSHQFNQGVHGVEKEETKHRRKKSGAKKNFLIEWKSKFFNQEEDKWVVLKAYATLDQRDEAFKQMLNNYTKDIAEIRKRNREEVI